MTSPVSIALIVNSVLQATQNIQGGQYAITAVASVWNSNVVTLNFTGPDGVTLLPLTPTLTANGFSTIILIPAGKLVATQSSTSTGLYVYAQVIPTTVC